MLSLWVSGEITWRRPSFGVLYRMLSNPIYGGAYAYGKAESTIRYDQGGPPAAALGGPPDTAKLWTRSNRSYGCAYAYGKAESTIRYEQGDPRTSSLGGQLKTGNLWTGQNRQ